jgi:hypothetical protein
MNRFTFELQKHRDFGELISDTFTFFFRHWKGLVLSELAICGIPLLGVAVTASLQQTASFSEITRGGAPNALAYGVFYYTVAVFALSIATIIGIFATGFAYVKAYQQNNGEQPTVTEVWVEFRQIIARFSISQILLMLLTFGGMICCVLPGVWLFPITCIIMAAIVFEDLNLSYAFGRGFDLVSNHWWETFGAIFVIYLIVQIAASIFVIPLTVAGAAGAMLHKETPSAILGVLLGVVQSLGLLLLIIPVVTMSLSYFSLVEYKEGTSLLDKVNRIGIRDDRNDLPEEQY